MKITPENYEAYLLDLMEGKLSDEDKAALTEFLNSHPHLKEAIEPTEGISLDAGPEVFDNKEMLYRGELNEQNIEWYLAVQAEGDTNEKENAAIESFLQLHPEWKKQQQLFAMARIPSDPSVIFDHKSSLYKTKTISIFQKQAFYYAAAAIIAILPVTGYLLFEKNQPTHFTAEKEIPGSEIQSNNTINNLVAVEDTLQPSVEPDSQNQKDKIEKSNRERKTSKPVYRIIENRPLIAESKKTETPDSAHVSPAAETESASENFRFALNSQKLETIRNEIAQIISSHPNAFVPGALDKLIERMADGEEITQTELQQLIATRPSTQPVNPSAARTPLLDALAWSLNKISGKNVSLEKKFNDDGRLVAFELDAGFFRIGKEE